MPDSVARSAFPGILKRYMERDGLNQVDIANSLNVSKQTVSDWVIGKKFPRVDRMQQLADLFGVLMSEMYTPAEASLQDDKESISALSSEELLLISLYRGADDRAKEDAMNTLANHQIKDGAQKAI